MNNRLVPIEPQTKQQQFLLHSETKEVFYGGAAGGGKLLSLDTEIPTPSGFTTMGEIQVGDKVFSEDGSVTEVTWVSDIDFPEDSYAMEFSSGEVIYCCGRHLWKTKTDKERTASLRRTEAFRKNRRKNRPSRAVAVSKKPWASKTVTTLNQLREHDYLPPSQGEIRSTAEILDTLTVRGGRRNHSVDVANSLELPEVDLPIEPYLFGLWLGDGFSNAGKIGMSSEDMEEVLGYCQESPISRVLHEEGRKTPYLEVRFEHLTKRLRLLGVLRNKHIPTLYLRASHEQRIDLLRGLMDTDGHCHRNGKCEIGLSRKALIDDVLELICSLGIKATITSKRAKCNGKDVGETYRITFYPPFRVFNLPRKAVRQKYDYRKTTGLRYITSIRKIPAMAMKCIRVAHPSHMYLVGRTFIPTHNSFAMLMAACQFCHVPGYSALILRRSFNDLAKPGALIPVSKEWWTGLGTYNQSAKTWTFQCPGGGTSNILFGYLETDDDVYQYRGAAFQFIGFDELTDHTEFRYRFLFSRLRRPSKGVLSSVPVRMRSTSNPGGKGHDWVKKRFIDTKTRPKGTVFIPASLDDNPGLDREEYVGSLDYLDPVTRDQILKGDWDAANIGRFKPEWFAGRWSKQGQSTWWLGSSALVGIPQIREKFQTVDTAQTVKQTAKDDPDYTVVSTWWKLDSGNVMWVGCRRERRELPDIPKLVGDEYVRHGVSKVYIEDDGTGKGAAQLCRKYKLPDGRYMNVVPMGTKGKDKLTRAAEAANMAEAGRIWLPSESSAGDFPLEDVISEVTRFTGDPKQDSHDDIVDTLTMMGNIVGGVEVAHTDAVPFIAGGYQPNSYFPK